MSEPLIVFEPRELRTAGHTHTLYAYSPNSQCGDIEDGVGFCFRRSDGHEEGSWVIDFDDLQELVKDITAWRDQRKRSVGKRA